MVLLLHLSLKVHISRTNWWYEVGSSMMHHLYARKAVYAWITTMLPILEIENSLLSHMFGNYLCVWHTKHKAQVFHMNESLSFSRRAYIVGNHRLQFFMVQNIYRRGFELSVGTISNFQKSS